MTGKGIKLLEFQQTLEKRIPRFLLYLFVLVSYFFRSLYTNIELIKNYGETMEMYIADMGLTGFALPTDSYTALAIVSVLLAAVLEFAVLQIILYVYASLIRRRMPQAIAQMKSYNFLFNTAMFVVNVLIGLFALLYFAVPDLLVWGSYVVEYVILFAVLFPFVVWALHVLIEPALRDKVYMILAVPFYALQGLIALVNLVSDLSATDAAWGGFGFKTCSVIRFVLYVVSVAVGIWYYMQLKKASVLAEHSSLVVSLTEERNPVDEHKPFDEF